MHIACLPFPSAQGTQAAIASLLMALREAGEDSELLTYPFGDERLDSPIEPVRPRILSFTRSLRSGPSAAKLILDLQLVFSLRRMPGVEPLIAHHVEAAWAARLAGRPYHYVAHTSVEDELEAYFPRIRFEAARRGLRLIGAFIDRVAIRGARRCAAVSPALGHRLRERHERAFHYLPIPWSLPRLEDPKAARRALGLNEDAVVMLYTGNLDAYQRWEIGFEIAEALRAGGREVVYLIGTESDPAQVHEYVARRRFEGVYRVLGCAHEEERAILHAAADFALIPRRLDGGVPIKLLEALAHDLPALVSEEASAGLPLEGEVRIVSSGRLADYLKAAEDLMERTSVTPAGDRSHGGREFIARAHSNRAAVEAFRQMTMPRQKADETGGHEVGWRFERIERRAPEPL